MFEDMQFGLCIPPLASLSTLRKWWREIEDLGFDMVGVSDSPITREAYVSLAIAAAATSRADIQLMTTNPVTRDISVTANAIMALQDLAPNRIRYVFGAGDSAAVGVGLAPAKAKEIAEYLVALRGILAGETVEFRGRQLKAAWREWEPWRPNLMMAAMGEITLRTAGRVADGVIATLGLLPENIDRANELIKEGALQAERDPADITVWHQASVVPTETFEEGFKHSGMANIGKMVQTGGAKGKMLPPEVEAALQEAAETYSLHTHSIDNNKILEIAKRTGTMDYFLARRGGLIGPVDITERVERLHSYGVRNLIFIPRSDNNMDTVRKIAAATVAKRKK